MNNQSVIYEIMLFHSLSYGQNIFYWIFLMTKVRLSFLDGGNIP